MTEQELKIQVAELNERLTSSGSIYRLQVQEPGKVELLDINGGPTHSLDDEEGRWLDLQDLPGFVDNLIESELSYL